MGILCVDNAAWHCSKVLDIPENIVLFFIPPYTPELNPIEQIWKEIRKIGFHNEVFATLDKVHTRLDQSIRSLTTSVVKSITGRRWILSIG
jgi:putative transposase